MQMVSFADFIFSFPLKYGQKPTEKFWVVHTILGLVFKRKRHHEIAFLQIDRLTVQYALLKGRQIGVLPQRELLQANKSE